MLMHKNTAEARPQKLDRWSYHSVIEFPFNAESVIQGLWAQGEIAGQVNIRALRRLFPEISVHAAVRVANCGGHEADIQSQ